MAETVSLAVLENLVHLSRGDFPSDYIMLAAIVPDDVSIVREEDLVGEFGKLPRWRLGDLWIEHRSSAVLSVRSLVVPFEHNYLLNPRHPDFELIAAQPAVPFAFDERLFHPPRFR